MILMDRAGHLASDESLVELHGFADRTGIARGRFHGVRRRHPHYDVRPTLRGRVLMYGAREVTSRALVKRMIRS